MACLKKGNVAIFLVAIFTLIIFAGGFAVLKVSQNVMNKTAALEKSAGGRPIASVTTGTSTTGSYQNPFTASSQASNPFDSYQNPFEEIQ